MVQVGGLVMIILGCLGKFGALFVTIPDPVIGGLFMVTFGKYLGMTMMASCKRSLSLIML